MGQIKITITIDEENEGKIYGYLSKATARRRATLLLDLAMKRLDQEYVLGLIHMPGESVSPIETSQTGVDNGQLDQSGFQDTAKIGETGTPVKGAEVAKSLVDLIDVGGG
jgi:hypothetical protein